MEERITEEESLPENGDKVEIGKTKRIYTKDDRFIAGLEDLRFISAVWLFWEHFGWEWTVTDWDFLVALQYRGQVPLQYFFLMGGMVMYAAYFKSKDFSQKKVKADYWLNRLSRVGPNYYLALFIELPITIGNAYYKLTWTALDNFYFIYAIITVPLMMQGWVLPTNMAFVSWIWGGLLWAMSPFAFFWFLFPWLVR